LIEWFTVKVVNVVLEDGDWEKLNALKEALKMPWPQFLMELADKHPQNNGGVS